MGSDQPHVTGPVLIAYVNKRSSALNASVAVGISRTAAPVQSSSYSRAVLFCCEEVRAFGLERPRFVVDVCAFVAFTR